MLEALGEVPHRSSLLLVVCLLARSPSSASSCRRALQRGARSSLRLEFRSLHSSRHRWSERKVQAHLHFVFFFSLAYPLTEIARKGLGRLARRFSKEEREIAENGTLSGLNRC